VNNATNELNVNNLFIVVSYLMLNE
jgi:hypothetical protein